MGAGGGCAPFRPARGMAVWGNDVIKHPHCCLGHRPRSLAICATFMFKSHRIFYERMQLRDQSAIFQWVDRNVLKLASLRMICRNKNARS